MKCNKCGLPYCNCGMADKTDGLEVVGEVELLQDMSTLTPFMHPTMAGHNRLKSGDKVVTLASAQAAVAAERERGDEYRQKYNDTYGALDDCAREHSKRLDRITQLEAALVVANSNHEEFERKWYLACDEIEELKETVAQLNRALREEIEAPTFMGEPVSLLREPVKSLADIKVCYCPPDKCQAPVIMGRQVACTRKMHPPVIAAIDSVEVAK